MTRFQRNYTAVSISILLLISFALGQHPANADQLPPFAKTSGQATGPQLPSNLVVVDPEKSSEQITIPLGDCWIWAAPKGNREYRSWSWRRYDTVFEVFVYPQTRRAPEMILLLPLDLQNT